MCIRIWTPSKTSSPLFGQVPLLNLQTIHPIYCFFGHPLPLKLNFLVNLIMLKFFVLNLIPSFKVPKFLVKIFQFKFLVVTEMWIHSEILTWHDKNIQSNAPYREVLTTQLNYLASLAKWLSVRFRISCGFESSCSHLNFRFCACFEQGVLWHSYNYRVWNAYVTWKEHTVR